MQYAPIVQKEYEALKAKLEKASTEEEKQYYINQLNCLNCYKKCSGNCPRFKAICAYEHSGYRERKEA